MSAPNSLQRLSLKQFADRFRSEMIPLGSRFCYFAAAVSLTPEDLREYLDEPVAALPPSIASRLPRVQILLVPYLEKTSEAGARRKFDLLVTTERPDAATSSAVGTVVNGKDAVLAFAVKDTEVADYHYRFYRAIAELVAELPTGIPDGFAELLYEEFRHRAHGELDENSWQLKQDLEDKDLNPAKPTKRFKQYLRQSFVDTLTLFLHGICCDIDVDTGPRQLASRLIRKRLVLLRSAYPPPEGYAVLPEDVKAVQEK